MGGVSPETCWASCKYEIKNLIHCCILLDFLCEVNEFSAFYGTRRFITKSTTARHLSLLWARSIYSMPPYHFLKIHFNIIFTSTPGSFKWSPSLRFPHHNPVRNSPLLHTCYMPRQSQSSWFDRQYHIWRGVQIIKLLSLHSCTISEAFEWIFNWH